MAYLLDSNVFIEGKNRYYGLDFCPAFWDWLQVENAAGHVFSIEKVDDELAAGGDELSAWAAARDASFFLPVQPGMLDALRQVSAWATGQRYEPAAVTTFLQAADYYLVGQALALASGTRLSRKSCRRHRSGRSRSPTSVSGSGSEARRRSTCCATVARASSSRVRRPGRSDLRPRTGRLAGGSPGRGDLTLPNRLIGYAMAPRARSAATARSLGSPGVRWPRNPVTSPFATSAFTTASSVAWTVAA